MKRRLHPVGLLLLVLLGLLAPSQVVGQEDAPPGATSPTETEAQAVDGEASTSQPVVEPGRPASDAKAPQEDFDQTAVAEEEASLTVWNRHIVELRANIGGASPQERADNAADLITSISDELLNEPVWHESTLVRGKTYQLIGLQNQVLLALRHEDIDPRSKQTLEELGAQTASRIQEVLRAKAEQIYLPNLVKGIGLSLVATLFFFFLVSMMVRLRDRARGTLARKLWERADRVSGLDLKPYLRSLIHGTVTIVFWAMVLPLAYLWLTFVLKRFPFTRPWGIQLGSFLVDLVTDLAIGAVTAIPGLFTVFLIFLINRFLTRIVGAFFLSVENEALHVSWLQPETAKATRRVVIVVMWIFALTVAYPYIPGSNTGAFKGVSVFVGLMISLGATGLVNQIVSGMVIVYTRAFRPGEFVRIDETEGTVQEIGVLSTKISTLRKEHITIPNAVLVGTKVNNLSRDAAADGIVLATSVTIGYDAPWRQIHALLKMAAARCAEIRKEPEPRVLQRGLSDFYVEYTLLANIDDPKRQYVILSELHGHIQDVFNEHDVQIMSPHYLDRAEEPVVVPKENWTLPPAESD
jgi:small-conductance mechanosensitive channel